MVNLACQGIEIYCWFGNTKVNGICSPIRYWFFSSFIYSILKAPLQKSIKYIILGLNIYTNKIVKYNNYVDTTETLGTIRTEDECLPMNQIYINYIQKLPIDYNIGLF